MSRFVALALVAAPIFAAVLPAPGSVSIKPQASPHIQDEISKNIPLVLWHGLGDSYDSDGISSVGKIYQDLYPGSPVYFVHLGDTGGADRHASFFGNLTEQINDVCDDIRENKELSKAPAINGLGFSQGGVFIRGLIERCDAITARNLVTFGSPHGGITEFTACAEGDWWCKAWSGTLKGNTWSSFAQSSLIPAQYFRDSADLESFLLYSNFLADVNNEREEKEGVYKQCISAMEKFVMFKFQDEDVIHPPESSWFAGFNTSSGVLTKLSERDLYNDEWLGLKKLDQADGLIYRTTPGKHMQIGEGVLEDAFKRYFAPKDSGQTAEDTEDAFDEERAWLADLQSVLNVEGYERPSPNQQKPKKRPCIKGDSESTIGSSFLQHYDSEMRDTFA